MSAANDKQVAGNHYKDMPFEPWDFITILEVGYLGGNVIKYVSRHRHKNGKEDIAKAQHYLEKMLETCAGLPAGSNLSQFTIDYLLKAYCKANGLTSDEALVIGAVVSKRQNFDNLARALAILEAMQAK